jgi:ABC-2 type transport system ATP-binding protein
MDSPIVRAEHVTKTFGKTRALDDVTLSFEPGIIYGLLGPNGAGKTTLIRILTTLIRPDSGSATVDGIDVLHDPRTARTRMGLAGQFAAVDEYLTGRENVEMVGRLYNLSAADATRRATEVLSRIDLNGAADRTVRTYSGGMRRRLDLAASMVGHPKVLFLDEPTTGIDPRSRIDIWALIRDLVDEGTTILMTTQYLDEADQLAARVGVIDHGHLIAEGTPEELKDRLGGSVLEVVVDDADREATLDILSKINSHQAAFDQASKKITLAAPRGAETLMAAARGLDGARVVPNDITLRRPTLDDVFLAYTGHSTDESPDTNGRSRRTRARRSA